MAILTAQEVQPFSERLRQRFHARLWRWLDLRQTAAPVVRLQQKFMFVFPTAAGFALCALVLLLYVLGTNYQNNLIILLAYLLLVLFISTIVLAFLNLHHCELSARPLGDVYAGDGCSIELSLHRQSGLPQALDCGWQQQQLWPVTGSPTLLDLTVPKRGCFDLPRLKLQSVYPFGLIRCWCYIRLDCRYWVYPKPIASPFANPETNPLQQSAEEWAGQRQYQPGDPWRQLDWKRYSRQQQLLVHQFSAATEYSSELWLRPDLRLTSIEAQLSDLTARALRAEQAQQPFGLQLAHTTVAIGSGPAHLRQVLQVLALC